MAKKHDLDHASHLAQAADQSTGKKVYRSPQFRAYGNIREVTQGVGRANRRDNAGSGKGFKSIA